jgi:hypothetical protein
MYLMERHHMLYKDRVPIRDLKKTEPASKTIGDQFNEKCKR